MKKTLISLFFVVLAATLVVLAGCGGGGGGGTSTTSSTTGTLTNLRVEAFLTGTTKQVDAMSLVAGDVVDLRLVGFDSSNVKQVVSGATFGTTAPSSIATVSGNRLTAVATSAGTSYAITSTAGAYSANATMSVSASGNAIVTGLVRSPANVGIYLATVKFYSATNTLLATTNTVSDGTFRVALPLTAKKFTIDLSVPDPVGPTGVSRYYRQFGYGAADYTANTTSCLAPLPTLVAGGNALPHDIVPPFYDPTSPPPPPTGCIG